MLLEYSYCKLFFKENRDELDAATVKTVGEEPRLVMIVNEDNSTSAVFVVTDGVRTEKTSNLCDGIFHLCHCIILVT